MVFHQSQGRKVKGKKNIKQPKNRSHSILLTLTTLASFSQVSRE
jgi:hypothetical protein